MLAVRQRAACIVRRARPANTITLQQATRSYASNHGHDEDHDHHDHHDHHAPQVAESPGLALYVALGAIGFSMVTYSVSRDKNSSLTKWIDSITTEDLNAWEQRNTLRTDIAEKAAVDRHVFSSGQKERGFELRTPDLINSGSPHNVPAGHYINLDKVTEHYRQQHLVEEERKANRLAEANKE
ncbi:hypothetical protein VM1G_02798 [Cytospora mali]|uniref:NADH-ubiquinone oxidoreductase 17.8 kDa subunit, mitochondrial n=1 Tax=Cytospora mali TaxID=578113 RepID=A0A194VTF5_CYTMA|nr:hypothetical protein VM1G_02798 [Valsa mali]